MNTVVIKANSRDEAAYFDSAATTIPLNNLPDYREVYANPSSLHMAGIEAEKSLNSARESILRHIGPTGDIIFTSGATESNNLAVFGTRKKNTRVITSEIEHPSVIEPIKYLERRGSCSAHYLKPESDGRISCDTLAAALCDDVSFVSLFYVNSETGAINDIPALVRCVKNYNPNIIFHTDAAQAIGKVRADFTGVDLVSFCAHKIHGPKGIGALYVKKGIRIAPVIYGGGQQNNIRSGTENVPGAMAFAYALGWAYKNINENLSVIRGMRDIIIAGLTEPGAEVNFISEEPDSYSPYIINVSFEGIVGEVLLNALSADGFFISTGSACHSGRQGASVVSKIAPERAKGSVRISLSVFNTQRQCEALIRAIDVNLKRLRKVGIK